MDTNYSISEPSKANSAENAAPVTTDETRHIFNEKVSMSPQIGSLIGALAKARKQFAPIIKGEINPFFKSKYADLAAVIEATKDGLCDHGLAVLQLPAFTRESGLVEIVTLLAHSSGEWIKCSLEMPVSKTDAQAIGSATTYGRRYSYSALLNVASEADDDANAAVSKPFKKNESNEEFDQRTEDQQNLKVFEIQAIDEALKRTGKTEPEVSAYLDLIGEKRIEHIKRTGFKSALAWANAKGKTKGPVPEEQHRMAANKRLWAVASEFSIPENDVKQASYEKFGVDSMTKLNAGQLDEMTAWIRNVAAVEAEKPPGNRER